MILYRADHRGNKTCPEKFYCEGLLTKGINSNDDPHSQVKYNWISTIKSHINPENSLEYKFYDTTEYLSCTSDMQVVDKYLKTECDLEIFPSTKDQAQAYVFELHIDSSKLRPVGRGLYVFTYECNYQRCTTDEHFITDPPLKLACDICTQDKDYVHKLLVIDAVQFLYDVRDQYQREYEKAFRDREWLLLPFDSAHDGAILKSRIAIANFWNVLFFKYATG